MQTLVTQHGWIKTRLESIYVYYIINGRQTYQGEMPTPKKILNLMKILKLQEHSLPAGRSERDVDAAYPKRELHALKNRRRKRKTKRVDSSFPRLSAVEYA